MIADTEATEVQFLKFLEEEYKAFQGEPRAIQQLRSRSWNQAQELGLPTKKWEAFQYLPLNRFYSNTFNASAEEESINLEKHIREESLQSCLVFVNGYFSETLSRTEAIPAAVSIQKLSSAFQVYGAFIEQSLAKGIAAEANPFAALNGALHGQTAFIAVPANCVVESPIQILHIQTAESASAMHPRLHIYGGRGSQAHFYVTHVENGQQSNWTNAYQHMYLEDQAHYSIDFEVYPPKDSWVFNALRAQLKKDATLKSVAGTKGSQSVRMDYQVALEGTGADATLKGAWFLDKTAQAHVYVLMDHQAENCTSSQLFKGILDGRSHSSFEGKVYVHAEAQKTDAFQLNNNLVLSDAARAESKPNLEIFADDVKASHGATVGQLDADELFYLQSRGIAKKQAQSLMVKGFCEDVLLEMKAPSAAKTSQQEMKAYLGE